TLLRSQVADISYTGASRFGGAITAGLFLSRFVKSAGTFCHFDIFGWVPDGRPGQPKGGEAQAIRALFSLLADRYRR
ncbi:MAG: leucyl aminopeptidase family protein, partial [Pseudomonadota bacterium]